MPDSLYKEQMGTLVATRDVLWSAVKLLSDDQAEQLRAETEAMAESLGDLWSDGPTDFRHGIIVGYRLLALKLRHRFDFVESEETASGEWCVICLECGTFPIADGLSCPLCETDQWLHVARI